MVPRCHLFRATPLLFGADSYRCAVHIAAGNHQYMVSLHAMVTSEYIGRKIGPSYVAQM